MYDIVAVDDSPEIRDLLTSLFRMKRWNTLILESPTEAIPVVETQGTHVLLTDINMPDMDGATFAHRVRAVCPEQIIVAFTGSVAASDLDPADFTRVLCKPCPSMSEFAGILADYLAQAKAGAGNPAAQ